MRFSMKSLGFLCVSACVSLWASESQARSGATGKSGQDAESGYVWANSPSVASYTPSTTYQYNSTGAINTITRSGVGAYAVRFPGLKTLGGVAQVTSYGGGNTYCNVGSWFLSGTDTVVNVRCFAPNGTPADSMYTVLFLN
jgi:hypothetical protein